jgi:hypothetical protein
MKNLQKDIFLVTFALLVACSQISVPATESSTVPEPELS